MTPFILWLKKSEIDELITLFINESESESLRTEVFSTDELMALTEKLLVQNDILISFLKNIKPFMSNEQIENQLAKNDMETQSFVNALKNINANKK